MVIAITILAVAIAVSAMVLCKVAGQASRAEEKAEAERWEKLKVSIRPDGVHELDPHTYRLVERHSNVTVEVLEDENGNTSVGWYRQRNTKDEL